MDKNGSIVSTRIFCYTYCVTCTSIIFNTLTWNIDNGIDDCHLFGTRRCRWNVVIDVIISEDGWKDAGWFKKQNLRRDRNERINIRENKSYKGIYNYCTYFLFRLSEKLEKKRRILSNCYILKKNKDSWTDCWINEL